MGFPDGEGMGDGGSDEEEKVVQFHSHTLHAQANLNTHHPNASL